MSATCEICGKEFKNTQGRRGHMTFVHGMSNSDQEDSVTRPNVEQQLTILRNQMEQLVSKVSMVDELSNKFDKQADILKQVGFFITRTRNIYSGTEYNKILEKISKLDEELQRLSRYIQYEFAGISNDIVWNFILDRPKLKKRITNTRHSLPDGIAVIAKTK